MNKIRQILQEAIKDRIFPGASLGFIKNGRKYFEVSGNLTYDKTSTEVSKNTIYDLASITKSIPVSSIILQLLSSNKLSLNDKVLDYIPELKFRYNNKLTVKHLLTYTAVWDLPQGLSYYAKQGPNAVLDVIYNKPLLAIPGKKYYYTNSPSLLLAMIIEKIYKKKLDSIADEHFFKPLNMQSTTFYPHKLNNDDVAPSEIDFRGELRGTVHDETAWAFSKIDRLAGNAGLFSNTNDLLNFCQMLLSGGNYKNHEYFSKSIFSKIFTNQIADLDAVTGLGWELNQPHFMGSKVSNICFGKTGFTGCSIVVDPKKQIAVVLLSNRIYPHRPADSIKINNVRSTIADILFI